MHGGSNSGFQLSSSVLHDVIKLVIIIKIVIKFVFSLWQRPTMAFLFPKLLRLVAAHFFDIDNQCSGKMLSSRDVTCFFDYRLLKQMCPSSGRLFEIVTK